jgi:hypothetical protein
MTPSVANRGHEEARRGVATPGQKGQFSMPVPSTAARQGAQVILNDVAALAKKLRRGDPLTAEETTAMFKMADEAGLLYYQMLTMVREQRSLAELPATLTKIIKTGAWRTWRWVGSIFAQNSLGNYLTSPPPNGVGIKLDTVEKLIADDPEAAAAYREEMTGKKGRPPSQENTDIVSIKQKPKHGNTRAYTLDRLKRERPDLFDKVKAGKLSANAAAIEAGFRKPAKTFERALKQLSTFTPSQLLDLRARIDELLGKQTRTDAEVVS